MGKERQTEVRELDEVDVKFGQDLYKLVAKSYLYVRRSRVISIHSDLVESLPGDVTRYRKVKVTLKARR